MLPVARDMWNVNCTVYGSLPTPPLCLFLSPFLSLFLLSLTAVWTALTVVIPGPVARTRTHLVHTIAIAAPICLSRHPWGCPVCPPMILDSCPRMLSSPNRHPPCHQKHLTRYVQAWEQKPEGELDSNLAHLSEKGSDVVLGYLGVSLNIEGKACLSAFHLSKSWASSWSDLCCFCVKGLSRFWVIQFPLWSWREPRCLTLR